MLRIMEHWSVWRGPLVALVVALALATANRFLRMTALGAAAGGAGVIAGWYAVTGRLWVVTPSVSVNDLGSLAAAALAIGLLYLWLGRGRGSLAAVLLAAIATGWFMAGAPRTVRAALTVWPIGIGVAVVTLAMTMRLVGPSLEPARLILAAGTLAVALYLAGIPPLWLQLALVPVAAALAMLALPAMPGLVALPVAVDIAALASLVAIALGRMPRLGFTTIDAASLSPLLAVWLAPLFTARLARLRQSAVPFGCLLAGAVAVGCVWLSRQVLPR